MRLLQHIPDRTKLFLIAFWVWTWILLQFSRLCSALLKFVLIWVPDNYIPAIRKQSPVNVIEAIDEKGNSITNKLRLFLNLKWDKDMCDGKGGVDLDDFALYIGASLILVSYILDYELGPIYNEFVHSVNKKTFGSRDITNLIKSIVIDFSTKIICKLGPDGERRVDSILFGEIDFH